MALITARLNAGVIFGGDSVAIFFPLPPPSYPIHPFSPSLISLMVSVDVKHHVYLLYDTRSTSPLVPVPDKPYGFCGR